jgi:hypothetical protein
MRFIDRLIDLIDYLFGIASHSGLSWISGAKIRLGKQPTPVCFAGEIRWFAWKRLN